VSKSNPVDATGAGQTPRLEPVSANTLKAPRIDQALGHTANAIKGGVGRYASNARASLSRGKADIRRLQTWQACTGRCMGEGMQAGGKFGKGEFLLFQIVIFSCRALD
jgi:hypothetical protein